MFRPDLVPYIRQLGARMGLLPLETGPHDHLFRGKLEQLFKLILLNDGAAQVELARKMKTNRSNVARWTLQLERMGLISRGAASPTRSFGLYATKHGREIGARRKYPCKPERA